MKWALSALILSSCATPKKNMENRDLEQLYQGAGVERYFLPDIPEWSNFSASSSCVRTSLARYLNFKTIRDSYAMSYEDIVHMQHMLNRRFHTVKSSSDKQLYLKDEAFIFYNVYEQVAGGSRDFLPPQFDKISLIWIDPYLENPSRVGKILELEKVGEGHPVLVSACMDSYSMEKLSEKQGWDRFGVKHISHEMFTPYVSNYTTGHDYILDFSLFLPNKVLTLFAPSVPAHFKGIKKIIEI